MDTTKIVPGLLNFEPLTLVFLGKDVLRPAQMNIDKENIAIWGRIMARLDDKVKTSKDYYKKGQQTTSQGEIISQSSNSSAENPYQR